MDRKRLLIAEKEPQEVMELRKVLIAAGYEVRIATNGPDALVLVESFHPDLLLAEMRLPIMDGPHLLQEIRNNPATQWLPFILIGSLKTLDERLNAMKLPVDDYLPKPLDPEETVARIESLIREVEMLFNLPERSARGFSGNLAEMSLVDLLQTMEVGKKTAVLRLRQAGKEGTVYITDGQVIDACLADMEARAALLRMFTWHDGTFKVEIRMHDQPRMLTLPARDLISEGMTRMYRWEQLCNQLPPLQSLVKISGDGPHDNFTDEENGLMRMVQNNGARRIIDLIEESSSDDLRVLTVFKNLYERRVLQAQPLLANNHQNHDQIDLLKRQQNGKLETDFMSSFFQTVLSKPPDPLPPQHDRRRNERRLQEDRRKHDRRRDGQQREKNRIFLNKSELLMIRKKLAHDA